MVEIAGVKYTRTSCYKYLCAVQNFVFKHNSRLAAGMDFALHYFMESTKHLIEEERSFDEAEQKRLAEWDAMFTKSAEPLLKSIGLGERK